MVYEVIWVLKMFKDLNVTHLLPIKIYCDNKSAIQRTANQVFHE